MLVSIASYHLWVDWRKTGIQMARWFTDFEAGFIGRRFRCSLVPLVLMRIVLFTVKQSEDQDPDGIFIKQWIPELKSVPLEWIHQPWRMP